MEAIVLIGIRLAVDRDPRKVAKDAKEALEQPSVRRLEHRGLPDYGPKVRWERGREKAKPDGKMREPHKVEVELRVPARDLPTAIVQTISPVTMGKILTAADAEYSDVLYLEADCAHE